MKSQMGFDDSIVIAVPKSEYSLYQKLVQRYKASNNNNDIIEDNTVANLESNVEAHKEESLTSVRPPPVASNLKNLPVVGTCEQEEVKLSDAASDANSDQASFSRGQADDNNEVQIKVPPTSATSSKKSKIAKKTSSRQTKTKIPQKKKKELINNVQSAIHEAQPLIKKKYHKRFSKFQCLVRDNKKIHQKLNKFPCEQLSKLIACAFSTKNCPAIKGEERFLKIFENEDSSARFIFVNKNYRGNDWYRLF